MMILRWFLSKTVREAVNMKRHVRKLLRHQQDVLTPEALEGLQAALSKFDIAIAVGTPANQLRTDMGTLEEEANKWLRPYPNAAWRENIEMLLVAMAVAMAIRSFWLQPFKIPTGSMQPTLFGVTSENLINRPDFKIPTGWQRIKERFAGVSYLDLKAKAPGQYQGSSKPLRLLIFTIKQSFLIGGQTQTVWFPPDGGGYTLAQRAGLEDGSRRPIKRYFQQGEQVALLRAVSGDHLFVNRMKYNFVKPSRGDIVVFETKGIKALPQDQFYIKRLIGLGGEEIRIGNDRHLIVDGDRLDASTPGFEFVYSFDPSGSPEDSEFSGHVNTVTARSFEYNREVARLFPNENAVVRIPDNHLMVMGDNTLNSKDSRAWGTFDENQVIGNAAFVYWPISPRFGWGFR